MRLSEAIRLGALWGPQIRGAYVSEQGGSCALGAAIQALSLKPEFGYAELRRVFPGLRQPLVEAIVQRNDFLGWTREQIADWLVSSGLDCEAIRNEVPQPVAEKALLPPLVEESAGKRNG
jgi:hypothetical protein